MTAAFIAVPDTDPRRLPDAFGSFATGVTIVTIVTTRDPDGADAGLT